MSETLADATPSEIDAQIMPLERAAALLRMNHDRHPDAVLVEALRIDAELAPLLAEWTRRQWDRYYVVTSGASRLHAVRDCRTVGDTTVAILHPLSGMSVTAVRGRYGSVFCGVCYPGPSGAARLPISQIRAMLGWTRTNGPG